MSKRKNLKKRSNAKLKKAARELVQKLTPEQQDKLAELLAKAVTDNVADHDTLRS
jgi:Spy/CpxP family protein refolding chaperone